VALTEAEWLSLADPAPLLEHVRGTASDRKLRLWACACVRRIAPLIPHELGHKALAVVERYVRELLSIADAFYPCGLYNATYDHPATRAAHSPLYRETVGQAAAYALRCRKQGERDAERAAQATLCRDVFGNPFRLAVLDAGCHAWHGGTVARLAGAIYEERVFDRLPILADALEDAGCTDAEILSHCRSGGEHVRGCWVVDLLLRGCTAPMYRVT
jgi:hypothetical protein